VQQPTPRLPPGADLDAAWLAEAGRSVCERLPRVFLILIGVIVAAWLPWHAARPERDLIYAVTLGLDLVAGTIAIAIARLNRDRPRVVLNAAAAGATAIALAMAAFHLGIRGELELLAMAFSFILFGTATVLPWGARRQAVLGGLLAGIVVVAAVAIPAIVSTGVAVFATAAAAAVTVYGAALGERQLRGLLARDLALEQANAELGEASRLKSEFVAAVSHELRTPVNVILGYADMLLEGGSGALEGGEREPLLRIRRNAEELHALVTTTLDLGRLEQGAVEVTLAPVAVADILERVRRETRELQERSGLTFQWLCDDALPLLETDAAKVDVVLKNLVTNAVKFTDRGTITVAARARDGGVELSVRDTGVGIAADAQRAIFDAFRQGAAAATRSAGGVGLGLHIVRRLLTLLGGTIVLDSEEGRGSTFRVWLPRAAPRSVPRM